MGEEAMNDLGPRRVEGHTTPGEVWHTGETRTRVLIERRFLPSGQPIVEEIELSQVDGEMFVLESGQSVPSFRRIPKKKE